MKFRILFILFFCYATSSHQLISSTLKKGIFQGNINSDPRCVIVSNYANMPKSTASRKSFCKTLCIQNENCTGYLSNETSCTILTYMVLPSLATDVGTEYYALQDAADSTTAVDIARKKTVTATNLFYIPPMTAITYAVASFVTSGILCYRVITDCWCGVSSLLIDLGTPQKVSRIVITPHPDQLTILGINTTTIYIGNASNVFSPPPPVFAVIQTIPTAGQKMTFTGNLTGQYILFQKTDPTNNLCCCFVQAFN